MRRCIFTTLAILIFSNHIAICQEVTHERGGRYTKKVEYNILVPGADGCPGLYNLFEKSMYERILWGSTNSPVEFVFEGDYEGTDEVAAFRVTQNPKTKSYQLEIARMPDMVRLYELSKELSAKVTQIKVPKKLWFAMPNELKDSIIKHNDMAPKLNVSDDLFKPYRPQAEIIPISEEFAKKLQDKFTYFITAFKGKGIPPGIFGGYGVTFRSIVGDEMWSIEVHVPKTILRKLSDICLEITRTDGNKIDEAEYTKLLDEL